MAVKVGILGHGSKARSARLLMHVQMCWVVAAVVVAALEMAGHSGGSGHLGVLSHGSRSGLAGL